jgi:hypothetical protein
LAEIRQHYDSINKSVIGRASELRQARPAGSQGFAKPLPLQASGAIMTEGLQKGGAA